MQTHQQSQHSCLMQQRAVGVTRPPVCVGVLTLSLCVLRTTNVLPAGGSHVDSATAWTTAHCSEIFVICPLLIREKP